MEELKNESECEEETCKWIEDTYGRWHTSCNKLADNNPLEYTFCPYCGKMLRVKVPLKGHDK